MRTGRLHMLLRPVSVGVVAVGLAGVLSGCDRDKPDDLRGRVGQWFALGDTLYFNSTMHCTAALYELDTDDLKAALPLSGSVGEALARLKVAGIIALRDDGQSPDVGFVEMMNMNREMGVALQATALEGKSCMDETAVSALHYAMSEPRSVMVYDRAAGLLVLMDPAHGFVVVAGSGD